MDAAIRLTGLTKAFGPKVAVDGVTFAVPAGSIYGLIGPNGAGKTTTFSLVAGFLRPTSGSAEVLGHAPSNVDALRGRLGVLPQDALLPANENVGAFLVHLARIQNLPQPEVAARRALEEVEGEGWWAQRCGSLSHGMAKRVGLAQALMGSPEVVLLDEPTAGLDPKVAHAVREVVRRRRGLRTVGISSHNLHELEELCDGAAILDHGRLVTQGSLAQLTAATEEVQFELAAGPVPTAAVRRLEVVTQVDWDERERVMVVGFKREAGQAEDIIAAVLPVLLGEKARISGVTKGRGLEKRVIDLTSGGSGQ
jgi:ABC-2 type transport system ATP-binding protein